MCPIPCSFRTHTYCNDPARVPSWKEAKAGALVWLVKRQSTCGWLADRDSVLPPPGPYECSHSSLCLHPMLPDCTVDQRPPLTTTPAETLKCMTDIQNATNQDPYMHDEQIKSNFKLKGHTGPNPNLLIKSHLQKHSNV